MKRARSLFIPFCFVCAYLLTVTFSCKAPSSKTPAADSLACTRSPQDLDTGLKIIKSSTVGIATYHLHDSLSKQTNDSTSTWTKVVIHEWKGYDQDTVFAKQAAQLLETIINSPDFRNSVLANNYGEDKGFSRQEIYDLIMNAHEPVGAGGQDHVIDLYLRVINSEDDDAVWLQRCNPGSSSGTIGIDGAGTGVAAVCSQWLRSTAQQQKPAWLAAHFLHEYMHVLGFKHRFIKSRSVPYKIQNIIERLGD